MPRPGLEPGPFDPESSALTIRPPRLPRSHDTLFLVIIRLIICFLYHLKNYILNVIQLERLVRHSSSTEETHWSLQVLTEEMKCNRTNVFLFLSYYISVFYFIMLEVFWGKEVHYNNEPLSNSLFIDYITVRLHNLHENSSILYSILIKQNVFTN